MRRDPSARQAPAVILKQLPPPHGGLLREAALELALTATVSGDGRKRLPEIRAIADRARREFSAAAPGWERLVARMEGRR